MRDREQADSNRRPQERQLTCPVCKRRVTAPSDDPSRLPRFFPFCSERCKLIDLGAWLDADYRIPAKPDEDSDHPPSAHRPTDEKNTP